MNPREHFEKYKIYYISAATGVAVATITMLVMRSNIARGEMSEGSAQRGVSNTASHFSFGNRQTINITTVLDREGRGHPGWPIRNLEFDKIFLSQREGARYFDISEGLLSGHLNGKFPDVDGLHFERVNLKEFV